MQWHNWRKEPPNFGPRSLAVLLDDKGEYMLGEVIPGGFTFRKTEYKKPYISRFSPSLLAWALLPGCPLEVLDSDTSPRVAEYQRHWINAYSRTAKSRCEYSEIDTMGNICQFYLEARASGTLTLPRDSLLLSVQVQYGRPILYVRVGTAPRCELLIVPHRTNDVSYFDEFYIGTAMLENQTLAIHYFATWRDSQEPEQ